MEDLLNGCCNPSGVVGDWLLTVPQLPDVTQADYKHAYILPDDTVWVLNSTGDGFVQLNGGSGGGSNVTFVDNGDGTGTITINGVPNTVITEDNVGLEIGARNILRGTANPILTTSSTEGTWANGKFFYDAAGGIISNVAISNSPVPSGNNGIKLTRTDSGAVALLQYGAYLQKGYYTTSVWVKGTEGAVVGILGVRTNLVPSGNGQLFTLESGWNRLQVTQNVLTTGLKDIFRFALVSNVIGEEVTILAPQVERSNIASDWRPAPEDNFGLKIGARNILRGTAEPILATSFFEGSWSNGKFASAPSNGVISVVEVSNSPVPSVKKGIKLSRTALGISMVFLQLSVFLEKGKYTSSFWISGTPGAKVGILGVRTSGVSSSDGELFTVASGWNKIEVTENVQLSGNKDIFRIALVSNVVGEEITILAPQVERSNIASDWRPAPEDYVSIGGGITEAPIDGKLYGRKDGAWVEIVIPAPATLTVNSVEEPLENISVEDL